MTAAFDISPPDGVIRKTIETELDRIEASHDVRILLAVESGSRAWGFPSPDSDYDVRFVYVHRPDWYLTIAPGRDVIEIPIDDELDISGWDLKKALALMVKPNPVLLEWLRSPVVYRRDDEAVAALNHIGDLAERHKPSVHHYFHLCRHEMRRLEKEGATVPIKIYFYAIRCALALRWIRLNDGKPLPMTMASLIADESLANGFTEAAERLAETKKSVREKAVCDRVCEIDRFILEEMDYAESAISKGKISSRDLTKEADDVLRALVRAEPVNTPG